LKGILLKKYGAHNLNEHFADTRDTLCYATNNNQKASIALLNSKADMVFVIGGKNSSNTTQLYKIFEGRFPSYFIENAADIVSNTELVHWNYKQKNKQKITYSLLQKKPLRIIISSGASCPEIVIDEVLERLLFLTGEDLGKWKLANT
jgi:4-hydroxy-3-methylbut-2-enyl diphosphate reductase